MQPINETDQKLMDFGVVDSVTVYADDEMGITVKTQWTETHGIHFITGLTMEQAQEAARIANERHNETVERNSKLWGD